MLVIRKEKETNQQVLRRFNRLMQLSNLLQSVRDRKEFIKQPNRHAIKESALRRETLRKAKQWY